EPYKVFASIPFNRTAAIVRALTDAPVPPEDQYLVVQREAAERFSGRPATTLPAVLLHPWFEIGITHRFQRTDFTPVPGVDVVLLRLAKRGPPLVAGARMALYRDFVTAVFTAWQPTVADALRRLGGAAWAERVAATAEVAVCAPPSRLPPADWLSLFEAFARLADVRAQHRVTGAWARLEGQHRRLKKRHRTRTLATGPGPPLRCCARAVRRRADGEVGTWRDGSLSPRGESPRRPGRRPGESVADLRAREVAYAWIPEGEPCSRHKRPTAPPPCGRSSPLRASA
ncbi:MAG TPA: rRNA adenine N-6-methyltransferase family protein, partial [Dehalococcoidia bacterium]|nr:rRNA adenine N-6-methyltransferase family protein [Dehalococcoidia bacterium]